jgi:clathrin heavy chain
MYIKHNLSLDVYLVCRLVLAQNKKELLVNWWNDGKLEPSEELGDMVSAAGDKDLALKIYQLCGASGKVCADFCWRTSAAVGLMGRVTS